MRFVSALVAAIAALALAGCSDSVDEAERALVVEWLIDHDETPETAECLAGELSSYEVADFDALAAISDNEGVDEDFFAAVEAAQEVCGA